MTTIDPPSWYQYFFYNPPLNTPRETLLIMWDIITNKNIKQLNQHIKDRFHHSIVYKPINSL